MPNHSTQSFFQKIQPDCKKLLLLDLGFLGDTIHLFPTITALKEALPETELHVMVSSHVADLLQLVPGVDKVVPYPRFPKAPPLYRDWKRIASYRAENYDAIINLNGSDRSVFLTALIGAKHRLGRVPKKQRWFWKFCMTDAVNVPYFDNPTYQQKWQCLQQTGFPVSKPEFKATVPQSCYDKVNQLLDNAQPKSFIHISPFTNKSIRNLNLDILIPTLNLIQKNLPQFPLVLTCAPTEDECQRMDQLVAALDQKPWKVLPGKTVGKLDVFALIDQAALHIGGDTGTLHVAQVMNTPSVTWFHKYDEMYEWLPRNPIHATIIGTGTPQGITNITPQDILATIQQHSSTFNFQSTSS